MMGRLAAVGAALDSLIVIEGPRGQARILNMGLELLTRMKGHHTPG